MTARRICMKSLLTQVLLFAANTNLGYRIFLCANKINSQTYFLGFLQNQVPRNFALVNLTTDRKIVMKQRA